MSEKLIQLNWTDRLVAVFFPNAAMKRFKARQELAKALTPMATQRHGALPRRDDDDDGGWVRYDANGERQRWEQRR